MAAGSALVLAPGAILDVKELKINGTTVINGSGTVVAPSSGLTLADMSCADDDVLAWDGITWECASASIDAANIVSGTIAIARMPMGVDGDKAAYGNHTHTDLTGDLVVGGAIQVGSPTGPCSTANEGAFRYDDVAKRMVYCNGSDWFPFTYDDTPDPFTFDPSIGNGGQTESDTLTLSGFDIDINVSLAGVGSPQLRIDTGSWASTGTLSPGQTLTIRANTPATGVTEDITVQAGNTQSTWTVGGGYDTAQLRTASLPVGTFTFAVADNSSQNCNTKCSNEGLTCNQADIQTVQAWAQDISNYRTLVIDELNLTFSQASWVATPMSLSQPYFGIGCGGGTWNFNGFGSQVTGCGQIQVRYDNVPMTCSASGYNNGNYSGPRICVCD